MTTVDLIEEFYKKNFDKLVSSLTKKAGTQEGAEDVVQEAFTRALTYKDSYNKEIAPVRVWFIGILRNAMRDYLKAERNGGGVSSVALPKDALVQFEEHMSDLVEMSQTNDDTIKRITAKIISKKMPEKQVLWLYFIKNYHMRDIHNIVDGVGYRQCEYMVGCFKQAMARKFGDED